MTSFEFRTNSLFLRNDFESSGQWGIPIVKKQNLPTDNIQLLSCTNARFNDTDNHKKCGIHFFVDDYRFEGIYNHPEKTLKKYSQYSFLLTPDFSTYSDMNYWRQLESVAKNRWIGAFWQCMGLTVIPTVSWSDEKSFDFCFDGIDDNAIVAVGMIGCKHNKDAFLSGYNAMLDRLNPSKIIVYGNPFDEMQGNILSVPYYIPERRCS